MSTKSAAEIQIKQTKTTTRASEPSEVTESRINLAEKIDEYITRMGYTSVHTLGVVVQLLTVGKVRLDFREYTERLQLAEKADIMARSDAVLLVENYIAGMAKTETAVVPDYDLTQKIIIQTPKRTI
jgi:hypothetical protein